MNERTFGWIQNASDFQNLKNTVAIFCRDSEVNLSLRTDKLPRLIQEETLRNRLICELEAETVEIPCRWKSRTFLKFANEFAKDFSM